MTHFPSRAAYNEHYPEHAFPADEYSLTALYGEVDGDSNQELRVEFLPGGISQAPDTRGHLVATTQSWQGPIEVLALDVRLGDVTTEFIAGKRATSLVELRRRLAVGPSS